MTMVLWSGGADSTLALYNMLNSWYNDGTITSEQRKPETLTINLSQVHPLQRQAESSARDKIKKSLKKEYGWEFKSKVIDIDSHDNLHGGLAQATMWLLTSIMALEDKQPIVVGWIKGDDALVASHEINKMWEILGDLNNKKCPIWIPFINDDKSAVIKMSEKAKLLDLCWWCETPIKKHGLTSCGQCPSCRRMLSAHFLNSISKDCNYSSSINKIKTL